MMGETPFGHDRATARHDPGARFARHRDVANSTPAWTVKVIDPLLCLFDQSVPIDFPGQFFRAAADFFERLINRNGPDRHGELRMIHSRVA
jgi:hypothetical protein